MNTVAFDATGDLLLCLGDAGFKVSSKAVSMASPVLANLLTSSATTNDASGMMRLELCDDFDRAHDAWEVVLRVLNFCTNVPFSGIGFPLLVAICRILLKYECAAQFYPWGQMWCSSLGDLDQYNWREVVIVNKAFNRPNDRHEDNILWDGTAEEVAQILSHDHRHKHREVVAAFNDIAGGVMRNIAKNPSRIFVCLHKNLLCESLLVGSLAKAVEHFATEDITIKMGLRAIEGLQVFVHPLHCDCKDIAMQIKMLYVARAREVVGTIGPHGPISPINDISLRPGEILVSLATHEKPVPQQNSSNVSGSDVLEIHKQAEPEPSHTHLTPLPKSPHNYSVATVRVLSTAATENTDVPDLILSAQTTSYSASKSAKESHAMCEQNSDKSTTVTTIIPTVPSAHVEFVERPEGGNDIAISTDLFSVNSSLHSKSSGDLNAKLKEIQVEIVNKMKDVTASRLIESAKNEIAGSGVVTENHTEKIEDTISTVDIERSALKPVGEYSKYEGVHMPRNDSPEATPLIPYHDLRREGSLAGVISNVSSTSSATEVVFQKKRLLGTTISGCNSCWPNATHGYTRILGILYAREWADRNNTSKENFRTERRDTGLVNLVEYSRKYFPTAIISQILSILRGLRFKNWANFNIEEYECQLTSHGYQRRLAEEVEEEEAALRENRLPDWRNPPKPNVWAAKTVEDLTKGRELFSSLKAEFPKVPHPYIAHAMIERNLDHDKCIARLSEYGNPEFVKEDEKGKEFSARIDFITRRLNDRRREQMEFEALFPEVYGPSGDKNCNVESRADVNIDLIDAEEGLAGARGNNGSSNFIVSTPTTTNEQTVAHNNSLKDRPESSRRGLVDPDCLWPDDVILYDDPNCGGYRPGGAPVPIGLPNGGKLTDWTPEFTRLLKAYLARTEVKQSVKTFKDKFESVSSAKLIVAMVESGWELQNAADRLVKEGFVLKI